MSVALSGLFPQNNKLHERRRSVTYPLEGRCVRVCISACMLSSLKFAYQITPDAQPLFAGSLCHGRLRSKYHSGFNQQFIDILSCAYLTHDSSNCIIVIAGIC